MLVTFNVPSIHIPLCNIHLTRFFYHLQVIFLKVWSPNGLTILTFLLVAPFPEIHPSHPIQFNIRQLILVHHGAFDMFFSGPCRNIVNCLSWAVFYPVFKRPDTWTGEEEASVCVQRQDKTAPSPPYFFTQKYCNCQICVFACVKTFGLEKSSCSFCEFWSWGGCWVKSKYCSDFPLPVTFHTVSSSLLAVLHLVFWIWIPLFQRDTQCWLFL